MTHAPLEWATPFPDTATLQTLFEAQVTRTPQTVAVIGDDERLTYDQLNARANQISHQLRRAGVGVGDIVPIVAERSAALIAGIFGIVKAGAAYLPVLPDTPVERLRYMLTDSNARVVLTDQTPQGLGEYSGLILSLTADSATDQNYENPAVTAGACDLAYVIFTSGSTGRPKGVMVEHRAIVNRLDWMQRAYPIQGDDVVMLKTSIAFDVSVWELFWWALNGATVCVLAPGAERNPWAIAEAAQKHRVSVIHFVPSMLNVFLESLSARPERVARDLRSVRRMFTSGEALTPSHVRKFNQIVGAPTGAQLTNLYGPTEAAVDVTFYDCAAGVELATVPIGRPIQNTRVYVMRNGNEVPRGDAGELCIAGVSLARGYLNDPARTAEKFVDDPFHPGERMYRTGDIARRLPDGNLDYLGREDHQVKIRGMRIELGEIENVLREHADIADCIVSVEKPDENIAVLVAFLVVRASIDTSQLREYLQQRLPAHMIPNRFETIEGVPVTSSGKANRAALHQVPLHAET